MKPCHKCAALMKDDATQCRWCSASVSEPTEVPEPPEPQAGTIPASGDERSEASPAHKSSRTRLVFAGASVVLLVLLYTFLGFYTIQPIGAVPDGQTWLVRRANDEPFFNSADGLSLRRIGSVSLLTRAVALGQAPKERILVRLPFWEFAYLRSTSGATFDRSEVNSAASLPPATARPASVAAAPAAVEKEWEIVSIDSRVTESNDTWSKYAWKLTMRNKGATPRAFRATIEFQDKDGFIIDTDSSDTFVVPANADDTATGYALIRPPGAHNVARTVAKVGMVR